MYSTYPQHFQRVLIWTSSPHKCLLACHYHGQWCPGHQHQQFHFQTYSIQEQSMIGDVQLLVQPIKYNPGLWMFSWLVSGPLVMDEQPFHRHNNQENSLPLRYSTTHCFEFLVNPFTPESDQCQISHPAPPEILHHTVRRTWLFIAYSDERWF